MVGQVRAAYRDSLRWAREAAEAMAASAAQRLSDRGIPAAGRTARGPAHVQLAVLASETSADLLVVGSRGLGRPALLSGQHERRAHDPPAHQRPRCAPDVGLTMNGMTAAPLELLPSRVGSTSPHD